jgi:hypothetical protein
MSGADIRAMVKELGAMKVVLDQAARGDLADLYGALGLEVSYNHTPQGQRLSPERFKALSVVSIRCRDPSCHAVAGVTTPAVFGSAEVIR